MTLCNLHQNLDVNLVSLSDTVNSGISCNCRISLMNSQAIWMAVILVVIGIRCVIDVNLLIAINRWSQSLDSGKGLRKSISTNCHSLYGIGNECSSP